MNRLQKDISHMFPFLKGSVPIPLAGIYIILKQDKVMYVGKSSNVVSRITGHYSSNGTGSSGSQNGLPSRQVDLRKNFDKVLFVEETNIFLQAILEEFYIWKYNPPYNVIGHSPVPQDYSDKDAWTIIKRIVGSRRKWKKTRRSI